MKYLETKDNFKDLIKEGNVLVDFYAEWCGPCRMLGPILEEVSNENKDITIIKVNVDNFEDLAREYGIMSIPTVILFKNGKESNKKITENIIVATNIVAGSECLV